MLLNFYCNNHMNFDDGTTCCKTVESAQTSVIALLGVGWYVSLQKRDVFDTVMTLKEVNSTLVHGILTKMAITVLNRTNAPPLRER